MKKKSSHAVAQTKTNPSNSERQNDVTVAPIPIAASALLYFLKGTKPTRNKSSNCRCLFIFRCLHHCCQLGSHTVSSPVCTPWPFVWSSGTNVSHGWVLLFFSPFFFFSLLKTGVATSTAELLNGRRLTWHGYGAAGSSSSAARWPSAKHPWKHNKASIVCLSVLMKVVAAAVSMLFSIFFTADTRGRERRRS